MRDATFLQRLVNELHSQKPMRWQLARVAFSGSAKQEFLKGRWIEWILRLTPRKIRRPLALRILALSPHYFVYQWTDRYPANRTRADVLEAEFQRNRASRGEICDQLLAPHLSREMTVLDFGCGPGFLAGEVARHVERTVAVDVSRGAIACARQLNDASNIAFKVNLGPRLDGIDSHSVDLVYSFAVFQHLSREQSLQYLAEFARILKPGAKALCHFIIQGRPEKKNDDVVGSSRWSLVNRYKVRLVAYAATELHDMVAQADFAQCTIVPISEVAKLNDEIGSQHLAILEARQSDAERAGRTIPTKADR